MPPKSKAKLHVLAVEVPPKTEIVDSARKRRFLVGKQFATGGFGRIYTCTEPGKSGEMVVKIEPAGNGPLFTEVNVFQRILKKEMIEAFEREKKINFVGLPYVISTGIMKYKDNDLRYLIIPKYHTSLESIREKNGGKLSEKDSWTVARSVLDSLEYMHSKNYVHADVKAANILLEKAGDFQRSVLVDMGLARLSSSNIEKPDKKRAHNGTAIFTSRDAHRGLQPSYRGDIEILAYNILLWITGTLPWLALESSPDRVFKAKEKFCKDLKSSLNSTLKDRKGTIDGLIELFGEVERTKYVDFVNFKKLKNLMDKLCATSKSVSNAGTGRMSTKRPSVEVADNSSSSTPVRAVKKGKPKPKIDTSSDEEEVEDLPAPSTSHIMPKKRILKTTPSKIETKAENTNRRRGNIRAKIPSPTDQDSTIETEEEEELENKSEVDSLRDSRARRRAAVVPLRSRTKSLKRRSGVIIPGLTSRAVRVVPSSSSSTASIAVDKSTAEKENLMTLGLKGEVLDKPRAKLAAGEVNSISPSIKVSAEKMKKIPGVLNFPRGRRSIVINQIAKKYKRLVANKANEQLF